MKTMHYQINVIQAACVVGLLLGWLTTQTGLSQPIPAPPANGPIIISPDSVGQLNRRMGSEPYFSVFQDNYLLTGTSLNQRPTSQNSDVKFQISFSARTASLPWLLNTHLYFTYTQKSFWDVYKNSYPFRESNYNPGFGIGRYVAINRKGTHAFFAQLEHESNGRDSIQSRGWNRLSFIYYRQHRRLIVGAKVWIPLGQESIANDQELLTNYYGYGEITGYYRLFPRHYFILDWTIRKGTDGWKGYVQTGLRWKPKQSWNQYLYLQVFAGYGESLIDVRERVLKARLGFVFSPAQLQKL